MMNAPSSELSDVEIARYARQLILPEIGDEGQERLKASKIGIIGAGGLGIPILIMAASAGFGTITMIDDDVVELTNLNRQFIFHETDIGSPKAQRAVDVASAQNPHITITAQPSRFDTHTAQEFCETHDLIIDASDNPETRRLANQMTRLTQTALLFVSAIRFEGQMAFFNHQGGHRACYECLFPHHPAAGDVPNCATVGIVGPITAIMGSWAVLEAIKYQLGLASDIQNHLLLFDGLQPRTDLIKIKHQSACQICGA